MKNFVINSFVVVFLCCSKPIPHINGLDNAQWKKDRNGCMEKRKPMIEALETQKEKLKKLKEMQIIDLLGRPDRNELFRRKKKVYVYYLEPGPNCKKEATSHKRLIIRFNALGVANEVLIR